MFSPERPQPDSTNQNLMLAGVQAGESIIFNPSWTGLTDEARTDAVVEIIASVEQLPEIIGDQQLTPEESAQISAEIEYLRRTCMGLIVSGSVDGSRLKASSQDATPPPAPTEISKMERRARFLSPAQRALDSSAKKAV